MLDDILEDVIDRGIAGVAAIGDELVRQVKIYNYIPKKAEPLYQSFSPIHTASLACAPCRINSTFIEIEIFIHLYT